jgi:ion channel
MHMSEVASSAAWIVATVTFALVVACVGLHYEVLSTCTRLLPRLRRRRPRVLLMIAVVLLTHVAEIWLFALGYYFLVSLDGLGALAGIDVARLPDYFYFSSTVYTTVGFGDLAPVGHLRFLSGIEALTGLVMITWSASFTYLEMERNWKPH